MTTTTNYLRRSLGELQILEGILGTGFDLAANRLKGAEETHRQVLAGSCLEAIENAEVEILHRRIECIEWRGQLVKCRNERELVEAELQAYAELL